jgi:anti-sigma factor RsiW
MTAALAAYRAFGADPNVALEIFANDSRALAKKISPRYLADTAAMDFNAAGWSLIGARLVPGTASTAAFVLWENRERLRVGLLIEPLDAPAATPPREGQSGGLAVSAWTDAGEGFAAVGPDEDADAVAALVHMRQAIRAASTLGH